MLTWDRGMVNQGALLKFYVHSKNLCVLIRSSEKMHSQIWLLYNNILFTDIHGHTNSNIRFIISIKSIQFTAHKHSEQKWDIEGLRFIVQFEYCEEKQMWFFFAFVIKDEAEANRQRKNGVRLPHSHTKLSILYLKCNYILPQTHWLSHLVSFLVLPFKLQA